ncbi:hypothetical protein RCL1_008273 [Eukaryota sp. TZLM3-RCL]
MSSSSLKKLLSKLSPPVVLTYDKCSTILFDVSSSLSDPSFSCSTTLLEKLFKFIKQHSVILVTHSFDFSSLFSTLSQLIDSYPHLISQLVELDLLLDTPLLSKSWISFVLKGSLLVSSNTFDCFVSIINLVVKRNDIDLFQEVLTHLSLSCLTVEEKQSIIKVIESVLVANTAALQVLSTFVSSITTSAQGKYTTICELMSPSFVDVDSFSTLIEKVSTALSDSQSTVTVDLAVWLKLVRIGFANEIYTQNFELFCQIAINALKFCLKFLQEGGLKTVSTQLINLIDWLIKVNESQQTLSSSFWIVKCLASQLQYSRGRSVQSTVIDDHSLNLCRKSLSTVEFPTVELIEFVFAAEQSKFEFDPNKYSDLIDKMIAKLTDSFSNSLEVNDRITKRTQLYSLCDIIFKYFDAKKTITFLAGIIDTSFFKCFVSVYKLVSQCYIEQGLTEEGLTALLRCYSESINHKEHKHHNLCLGASDEELEQVKEAYKAIYYLSSSKKLDFDEEVRQYREATKEREFADDLAETSYTIPLIGEEPPLKKKNERFYPEKPSQHFEDFSLGDDLFTALLTGSTSDPFSLEGILTADTDLKSSLSTVLGGISEESVAEYEDVIKTTELDPQVVMLHSHLVHFMKFGGEGQMFALHHQQISLEQELNNQMSSLIGQCQHELQTLVSKQKTIESTCKAHELPQTIRTHRNELALLKSKHFSKARGFIQSAANQLTSVRRQQQLVLSQYVPGFVVSEDPVVIQHQFRALKKLTEDKYKEMNKTKQVSV